MDKVQESYVKCCGVNSYKDYFTTGPTTNTTGNSSTTVKSVPKSCCINKDYAKCKYQNLDGVPEKDMGIYLHVSYLLPQV